MYHKDKYSLQSSEISKFYFTLTNLSSIFQLYKIKKIIIPKKL